MRKTSSVAIVAGGAGGIGAATAHVLARRGVHVVIADLRTVATRDADAAADTTAHSTSEGAVISLTRALAREFAKSGIRVNAVSTDITTSGVNGRPRQHLDAGAFEPSAVIVPIGSDVGIQKIAHVVALLALDNTLFVTGKVYDIDGDMAR